MKQTSQNRLGTETSAPVVMAMDQAEQYNDAAMAETTAQQWC